MNKKGEYGVEIGVVIVILAVIGVFVAMAGFDVVDASHIGVKNRFGEILGTMTAGMQWTGLFTHVESYDMRMRQATIDLQGGNGAVDREGQNVYATIQINYKLKPDEQTVMDAYRHVGMDRDLATILNIDGIVREGFKTVTAQYTSLEIFQKRAEVKEKAILKIQENFPKEYFDLENVIISNIEFDKTFSDAIQSKKTNIELAKAKEEEVKIQKFEADKTIEQARGKKESDILNAEAEARKLLLKAESEAKSLELQKNAVTPLMIELRKVEVQGKFADRWNGALPMYNLGGNTLPILNIPTQALIGAGEIPTN